MTDTAMRQRNFFSLSPEEQRVVLAEAQERVAAVQRELSAQYKAGVKVEVEQRENYRKWNSSQWVCALVVRHTPGPASFRCSLDGEASTICLPFSQSDVQPESTEDFLLVCIPKWLGVKLGLCGVTSELSARRDWTEAQRESWGKLRRLRAFINRKIETYGTAERKPHSRGYFGAWA